MLRKLIFTMVLVATGMISAQTHVSPTRYDWSKISEQIVGETTDKYQQAYKIYRWLCDNIAYDTNYSIYTADEGFDNKRGVCQAYSEMFYRLGEPLGLKVEILTGKSKDLKGKVDDKGHAWVFVYTGENTGILVDPTWGAGTVNDEGVFTRNNHDDSWFHVDPYWMIFTHFPDQESYQLISRKIDYDTFLALPPYYPSYAAFRQNAHLLFELCVLNKTPQLPRYYEQNLDYVEINNLPVVGVLRVGQYYDFAFKKKKDNKIIINNGKDYFDSWTQQEGYEVCRYMPVEAGSLSVGIDMKNGEWSTLVKYQVAEPTAEDIANLEAVRPEASPVFKGVKNFRPNRLTQLGFDLKQVLARVKAEQITTLPEIYDGKAKYAVGDVPFNGVLSVGQPYTFRFAPYEGVKWAIINGDDWYQEWGQDPTTRHWYMIVTPQKTGKLTLSVQIEEEGSYWTCLQYEVR